MRSEKGQLRVAVANQARALQAAVRLFQDGSPRMFGDDHRFRRDQRRAGQLPERAMVFGDVGVGRIQKHEVKRRAFGIEPLEGSER